MPQVQPICTEGDYRVALAVVSALFENDPDPDTELGATFDAMVTLIEAYERKHYPSQ